MNRKLNKYSSTWEAIRRINLEEELEMFVSAKRANFISITDFADHIGIKYGISTYDLDIPKFIKYIENNYKITIQQDNFVRVVFY